jgi:transcriptional regulator with XRE-family HTH domain
MTDSIKSQNFALNLRQILLSYYPTLTEGARHLDINRQQLNKYLNGSSFPSARTLNRISQALNIKIDALLSDPSNLNQSIKYEETKLSPIECATQEAFKQAVNRNMREEEALKAFCGDYVLISRSALSDDCLQKSLVRIFQEDGKTFAKSLIALRKDGQPTHGIETFTHGSLVFWNSGCLHLLRMSHLGGGETDLGLMILQRPRIPRAKLMYGHALTTSASMSGYIVPSKVIMQKVSGNLIQLCRQHCGIWKFDSLAANEKVRDYFSNKMYVD